MRTFLMWYQNIDLIELKYVFFTITILQIIWQHEGGFDFCKSQLLDTFQANVINTLVEVEL